MPDPDFEAYAQLLKALAHPTRLRIVEILKRERVCVKNLGELMDLQQANLSQHLSILRNMGIVSCCREGNRICYTIRDPRAVQVLESLNPMTQHQISPSHGSKLARRARTPVSESFPKKGVISNGTSDSSDR